MVLLCREVLAYAGCLGLGEEGDDVAAGGLGVCVEPSPEGEGEALLLGAGHALVDADVVVEGFGGVAFGRVAPFQAHPDVDGFGVLQADAGDALAGLLGPPASLGVEEGNADENDAFRREAVEEEGSAGDISAEGCDGRDLDYRVEVLADGFLYAGDLTCGEGVEQLLADRLGIDDEVPQVAHGYVFHHGWGGWLRRGLRGGGGRRG